jgi:hypothetical protein
MAFLCKDLPQFDVQMGSPKLLPGISPHIIILTVPLSRHVAPVAGKLLLRYTPAIGLIQIKRLSTVNALMGILRPGCFILVTAPEHIEIPLYPVGRCLYGSS